jgi:hypothetical protein
MTLEMGIARVWLGALYRQIRWIKARRSAGVERCEDVLGGLLDSRDQRVA